MITLGSRFVALIVPSFVRVCKKYIPGGYVGLVSLAASILVFSQVGVLGWGGDVFLDLLSQGGRCHDV